jgi:hypothetical protein
MKYLARAARRLETGAATARPAIPSRSPLAEADQRLNLDSFASRFDLPHVKGQSATSLAADELLDASFDAPFGETESDAARHDEAQGATRAGRSAASRAADRERPRGHAADADARVPPGRETPAHGLAQTRARTTRRDERPAGDESESSPAREMSNEARTPEAEGPPRRRANALPDPSGEEGRAVARGSDGVESSGALKARQARANEAAESVFEALSRAMSWVESGARRALDAERGDEQAAQAVRPATPPRARPVEASPQWPARATPRDTRPVTHLEIGKIEVEVVAPPRPARTPAPPRPAQSSDGFGKALRQTFGWRQR